MNGVTPLRHRRAEIGNHDTIYHKLRRQARTVCAENLSNTLKCNSKTLPALSRRVVRGVYAKSGHSRKIRLVAKVIKLVGAPRVVRSAGQYCDEFKPYEFLYHRSNHNNGKKPRRKG